jgi:hypothetical protein
MTIFGRLKLGHSTPSQPLRKLGLATSDVDFDWKHAPVLSPDGASKERPFWWRPMPSR